MTSSVGFYFSPLENQQQLGLGMWHSNVFTFPMLPLITEHFLCPYFIHFLHWMELTLTAFPQIAQGYSRADFHIPRSFFTSTKSFCFTYIDFFFNSILFFRIPFLIPFLPVVSNLSGSRIFFQKLSMQMTNLNPLTPLVEII